ncbi:uncharacterized protein LOC100569972 [Acyrthosiphon pisum]|uniref:DUF4806 domain-containing protein n=1 Tax=Acyrthosiphon pisum TaxID=7029 RepID=A0A8R2AGD9_ACYPI|nr:uncharacterized protein LOC100569972 [Acyrthosiphon pisum]|eukprot:XP_003243933.1 PREDICTED: uncharacterized protein LOC100569972 [Acyrthosiphon pisum]
MWMVVQSLKDNSIKYVPKTWYNKKKKMCAWPIAKNYSKRLIEKMTPLHLFEYYWLPVRKIGRLYGSLEEARTKMYYARILTTLSVNREHTCTNIIKKTSENKIIQSPPTVKSKEAHSKMYYSNILSNLSVNREHTTSTEITRKTIENKIVPTPPIVKSSKPKQELQIEHDNKSTSTVIGVKDNKKANCGIPKQEQQIKHNNNSTSTTIRIKDNTQDNSDFQNQVLRLLTKMNDDILSLKSSLNIQHDTINRFDTFLKKTIGQTIGSQISNKSSITFDDIFPLKSQMELETFEEKIKGSKIFRNDVISNLSMLNNMNNIGNSVNCMMSKMFSDELVSQYSLSGVKQKKNFSNLSTYCLLIDAIRYNHGKLDIEKIDAPLAIWLSLAKFRIEQTKRKLISS